MTMLIYISKLIFYKYHTKDILISNAKKSMVISCSPKDS